MNESAWPWRFFYSEKYDRIVAVKQNACGCHPTDLLVEFSKTKAISLSFKNNEEIEEYVERFGVEL